MHNTKDTHIPSNNPINNDIVPDRKTSSTPSQITVAGPSEARVIGKQLKPGADRVDHAISYAHIATFGSEIKPDIVEIGSCARRDVMHALRSNVAVAPSFASGRDASHRQPVLASILALLKCPRLVR